MAGWTSPVELEDVDLLVRKVEYPAHRGSPLYRLMFPHSGEQHLAQREDEIKWTIDGLLETIHQGVESLYKACGEDGSPVGLIGWTNDPGASVKGVEKGNDAVPKSRGRQEVNWTSFTPPSLDVTSWLDISRRLRQERQKVIRNNQKNGICRKPLFNFGVFLF
jgi:hypothetical protein